MEFVAQPKRVLPLILLVDTSSSMSCCMEELNTAIRNMLEILKEQESLKAEVHVSFITFGNGGANLHIALRPIHNIEFKDFVEGGMTPLGGALRIAKDMVEDRDIIPSKSYAPIILLLSDGAPNDHWENELNMFINDGRSKKCVRMSLGIGKEFSSNDKVYEAKDSGNIIDFFKFMTMTIKEKTISKDINLDSEVFLNSINERFEKIAKDKE